MIIEEITITPEEHHRALQEFLHLNGIHLKVKSAAEYGYPVKGIRITVETPHTDQPAVPAQPETITTTPETSSNTTPA